MPLEDEAERRGGGCPADVGSRDEAKGSRRAASHGGLHAREHGGQGWTRLEWCLVEEQYGRTTNAIHWHVPNAYNVWEHASAEQIDRYLRPALRGELKDAYAVTERDAGSDPSAIEALAERTADGFRLNAEKWFVTAGDVASVYVVMANVVDGPERLPTLFVVDRDRPGVEIVDDPDYTHNYPEGHPTIRFRDVELSAEDVIGGVGAATSSSAPGSPRSVSGSRPAAAGRCGGCSTRRSPGPAAASRAGRGSSTTRGCRSRLPIRPPTPPAAACSP